MTLAEERAARIAEAAAKILKKYEADKKES